MCINEYSSKSVSVSNRITKPSKRNVANFDQERTTSLNLKSSDSFCGCFQAPPHLHNKVDRLVKFSEVPECLQFNKYVLSGYRRPLTYIGCTRSLLCTHNETGNILSHFLGLVFFVYQLATSSWAQAPVFYYSGVAALAACMLNSVLYHTFMNYTPHYDNWLCIDVLGIFSTFFFCQVSSIWFGFTCHPHLRLPCMLLYYSVAAFSLYKAMNASTIQERAKGMSLLGFTRGALLILRMILRAGSWPTLLTYVFMDVAGLAGAVINSMQIPEKWWPGKFDYFFNSHQIMHLFAFAALSSCYYAMSADYMYYLEKPCGV